VSRRGVIYGPGDETEFDEASYSLVFGEDDVAAAARNIDALTVLPNGNISSPLLSPQKSTVSHS
jgi:hypothetical protein